jgi:uridine kinase
MSKRLLIIAGGSGSGKSTLAANLYRRFPGAVSVLHLDDYYKKSQDVPILPESFRNADVPDALRFSDMARDIRRFLNGEGVEVSTKSELYNPDYDPHIRNRITHLIEPRTLIVVEGFLALHDPEIRSLAYTSIFLSMPIRASLIRRSANKLAMPDVYFSSVLIPSHDRYVVPSMEFAETIIDVELLSAEEVFESTMTLLAAKDIVL